VTPVRVEPIADLVDAVKVGERGRGKRSVREQKRQREDRAGHPAAQKTVSHVVIYPFLPPTTKLVIELKNEAAAAVS
jgi:hypothetical protein